MYDNHDSTRGGGAWFFAVMLAVSLLLAAVMILRKSQSAAPPVGPVAQDAAGTPANPAPLPVKPPAKVLAPTHAIKVQLETAVEKGDLRTVRAILGSYGPEAARWQLPPQGNTPLHLAGGNMAMLKLLVESGADVNGRNEYLDAPPLAFVAISDSAEAVNYLLSRGARVNDADGQGRTPLDFSEYHKKHNSSAALRKAGATRGTAKFTPPRESMALEEAIDRADITAVQKIIATADKALLTKPIPARQGNTPLHLAARLSNDRGFKLVQMLVAAGADVDAADSLLGNTPLAAAAANNSPRVVEYLLVMNADVNHADKRGRTALDFAEYHTRTKVVTLLLENGASRGSADFSKR